MLNTSIPSPLIHWIQSFLDECRAHVQLFNVLSSSQRFNQGLPKLLKLPSTSWRTFHSPPIRPSTQTEHCPFSISSHEGRIATSVPGITGRADDSNLRRQCSLTTIASYQANYVIYTDRSASGGTRNGGAAAVVTRGSPLQPEVVTTIKTKGRTFTSSYEEEAAAMESALSWTSANANHPSISILFCTDSKSLCEALISSHPRTFSIHSSINSILSSNFVQWIPGHSFIPGNNLADRTATEATTIATNIILPISMSSSI